MSNSSSPATFQHETVRALRSARGLSRSDLALLAGVSPETVRRAERTSSPPSARVIHRLAAALDVPVEELMPQRKDEATLRDLRRRLGRTQREMAATIGVSTQMVSRVECGSYSVSAPAVWAAAYAVSRRRWLTAWDRTREQRRQAVRDRDGAA